MKDFKASVDGILEKFSGDLSNALDEVIQEVAKEARKEVAARSPRKTGKYASGWKIENTGNRLGPSRTIYNQRPGLPHLLEYGHALRGGGRTKAQPHIEPVSNEIGDKIEEKLRRAME